VEHRGFQNTGIGIKIFRKYDDPQQYAGNQNEIGGITSDIDQHERRNQEYKTGCATRQKGNNQSSHRTKPFALR
jgi:hypothetical protein